MKRGFSLLLAVIMMISLTACDGNFGSVDLNDPIAIPQSGVIEKGIIDQIKMENIDFTLNKFKTPFIIFSFIFLSLYFQSY